MRYQFAWALLLALALPVRADDLTIALSVKAEGFEPARIAAPAGARVRLEVNNETATPIEFESFELNRERVIPPGQKATVYLSGLSAGKYEFFDDFNQKRRGALTVE
jgi:plastocyanin